MNIEKVKGDDENAIITSMIVSKPVLARISTIWKKGLFRNDFLNVLGNLCVIYYRDHKEAPVKNIESLIRQYAKKHPHQKETIEMIERMTATLSGEYEKRQEEINPSYEIERAQEVFELNNHRFFSQKHQQAIEAGDLERATSILADYRKIELSCKEGISPDNLSVWNNAFENREANVLIKYNGGANEFFGNAMERDGFISFVAPEKRGKCVEENTNVLLADGRIKTIRSIVESLEQTPIISLNESTQRFEPIQISDFWDNGEKDCWKVKTRSGRSVTTTSNHPYLTPDGWKNLEDLQEGDFIAVPKCLPFFGSTPLPEAEVKFLAYMLAEGGCTGGLASFTNTDPILIDDFHNCCDILGLRHRRSEGEISTFLPGANNFRRDKYPEALWRVSSKTKRIPNEIFQCPKEQIALFLRIFFSCDGHVSKEGDLVEIGLANRLMVKQIGHLLTRFGITYKFSFRWTTCNGKRFKAWGLSIRSQENVNLFLEQINGMSYKDKQPTYGTPKKSFLDKFPWQVAQSFYKELQQEYSTYPIPSNVIRPNDRQDYALRQSWGTRKAASVREQLAKKLPIMRQSFSRIDSDSQTYQKFMGSHILWDEVKSIKFVGKRKTYDLTIPKHHNFVANDCIVHNTYMLMDVAWRGVECRRKVMFFGAGDMTENQMIRRYGSRAAKRPEYPGTVKIPKGLRLVDEEGNCAAVTGYTTKDFEKPLTGAESFHGWRKMLCEKAHSKGNLLDIYDYPAGTLSVDKIRSLVDDKIRENWIPDIIVIDYADILLASGGRMEYRDKINETWKQLRALSSSLHCLVVTATQANRQSYDSDIIKMSHMGEDKRKLAHATGVLGINVKASEKAQGIIRLNWVVVREQDSSPYRVLHCASCLAIGNPIIKSLYQPKAKDERAAEGEEED